MLWVVAGTTAAGGHKVDDRERGGTTEGWPGEAIRCRWLRQVRFMWLDTDADTGPGWLVHCEHFHGFGNVPVRAEGRVII
jgi:hypothetical protein